MFLKREDHMYEFEKRFVGCNALRGAFAIGVALCLLPCHLLGTVVFEIALVCLEVAGSYDDGFWGEDAEGCTVEGVADDEVDMGKQGWEVELCLNKGISYLERSLVAL